MLIGGGLTFLIAYNYKSQWAGGGQRLQFGNEYAVELTPQQSPVILYYETANPEASSSDIVLNVHDPFGERIKHLATAPEDESFIVGGRHGYAAREILVDEPGPYRIKCNHIGYGSDADIPSDDSVVLLKQPQRTSEMLANHRVILVVGASMTFVLAVALYVVHGITLNRRRVRRI